MKGVALLAFLVSLASASAALGSSCKPVNVAEFEAYLADNSDSVGKIVFFASWCADCKESVKNAGANSVLVGIFDTEERIDRIYASLPKKNPRCFFDKDDSLAEKAGVKSLPYSVAPWPVANATK